MTTDIEPATAQTLLTVENPSTALDRLAQWVEAANNAHRLVAPLVDTAFVPDAYRPKIDPRATPEQKTQARNLAVANATAAVLQGISLGLDPMTSLQQIYVVHGRPGMYTKLKVALVQARGHDVWVDDLTDTRAVVCGRRKNSDVVERVTVTMDQARKAGWTSNQNYSKTPQDMLYARAAGRLCDRLAPEVTMGIASIEEIQDEISVSSGAGTRTVTPRRSRRVDAPPRELPPLEPEPAPAAEPVLDVAEPRSDDDWPDTAQPADAE